MAERIMQHGIAWLQRVERDLDGGRVLVRQWIDGDTPDASPLWCVAEHRDGALVPLCRCEHGSPVAATACRRVAEVLRARETAAALARCAALPAPTGALYVQHCDAYWPAADGGACPTCGAAGDVLVPTVSVRRVPAGGAIVRTSQVDVMRALLAAGLTSRTATVYSAQDASTQANAGEVAAKLRAAGWVVTRG